MQGVTGDPYAVLGVGRDATDGDIRAAWERRVTAAAKAGDLAGAQRVDAAYEVLRHPSRRSTYDRTGVVPQPRRLPPDERFLSPGPTVAFRSWKPPEPRRSKRRPGESVRILLVTLVVGAIAGTLWQVGLLHRSPAEAFNSDIWGAGSTMSASDATPTMHLASNSHRLLPAVDPPRGVGGYSAGTVRWDPCQPIRYVVSGVPPFPGAEQLLRSAISDASQATGLVFVYAGNTDELASDSRASYQPQRYGDRWAPVLVAWTDADVVPRLGGSVVGLGGAAAATPPGDGARLVSGIVYLDAPDLAAMLQRPTGQAEVRAVMLHELGHLVGLQHVDDPTAVMYPEETPAVLDYSTGDRRGLAFAGDGSCMRVR